MTNTPAKDRIDLMIDDLFDTLENQRGWTRDTVKTVIARHWPSKTGNTETGTEDGTTRLARIRQIIPDAKPYTPHYKRDILGEDPLGKPTKSVSAAKAKFIGDRLRQQAPAQWSIQHADLMKDMTTVMIVAADSDENTVTMTLHADHAQIFVHDKYVDHVWEDIKVLHDIKQRERNIMSLCGNE